MRVGAPMPFGKERMVHNSRFWRPGECQHPPLSRLNPGEHAHQAGGFSLRSSFCDAALPKAVHPMVPCLRASKELIHWFNAVTFLRLALRQTTRTFFSSQGTEESI